MEKHEGDGQKQRESLHQIYAIAKRKGRDDEEENERKRERRRRVVAGKCGKGRTGKSFPTTMVMP